MRISLRLAWLLASLSCAHEQPRWASSLISQETNSLEGNADPRLVFSSHALLGLGGLQIPVTLAEMEAAKQPGFVHWAASNSKAKKRGNLHPRFEFAEHAFLGDTLVLKGPNGTDLAPRHNFTLPNSVTLSYGEINALAGDFYGTYDPISDGATLEDRIGRFRAAYALLATDTTRQPQEARDILSAASAERAAFDAAVAAGQDPSAAYANLGGSSTLAFEWITITRPLSQPGYLGLAAINFDHFGADARRAYDAGHMAALRAAASGDLLGGYAMNAFADHFLQDQFAAGHLRTPRRLLHGSVGPVGGPSDLCARYMHAEDNAIGLNVTNPRGASWVAYGDSYLLDAKAVDGLAHAHNALQISAGEVFSAWEARAAPTDPAVFGAWLEAPTLESAGRGREAQALAPLFTDDGKRRSGLGDRRTWEFTSWYTYVTTVLEIELGDDWDYPITI